jgi:hypothetical protein
LESDGQKELFFNRGEKMVEKIFKIVLWILATPFFLALLDVNGKTLNYLGI